MELIKAITETREAVTEARTRGATVGLVPTMGALHEGHLSLVRAAREREGYLVVSIFVNPTQFGPQEDLDQYPRPLEADLEACRREGVDLVFAPSSEEMYPENFATTVSVSGVTEPLCGRFRPGHFDGVTTVVCKLLNIVRPDRAYFGQKDYQQLVVVRRMVANLDMPVTVVGCPTVREADGLAMSSRNQYLSAEQRAVAPELYRALQVGAQVIREAGTGEQAVARIKEALVNQPQFRVQYVEAVDPESLQPHPQAGRPVVLAAAAFLGDTRLIDNAMVE